MSGAENFVRFLSSPPGWNILDRLGYENQFLSMISDSVELVLIYESFDVELAENKNVTNFVIAEISPIFVNLTVRVLDGWCIG